MVKEEQPAGKGCRSGGGIPLCNDLQKGKGQFPPRSSSALRKDHDHGSGHFLKPEGRAEEKWAGMRLPAVHCQQWTRHGD